MHAYSSIPFNVLFYGLLPIGLKNKLFNIISYILQLQLGKKNVATNFQGLRISVKVSTSDWLSGFGNIVFGTLHLAEH